MPSPPTTPAQRYLDVLRTLGVTDGTIRRQHGVAPEESLQVALEAALEAPTDELLDLLAASGVVVDLEEVAPVDADRLAMALARFGFVVECSAVGDDMEIVGFDAVAEDVEHLRVEPEREALRSALVDRLLGPAGVEAVQLVDGRTLVADRRALAALRDRYGSRIAPFDTPLLAAGIEEELVATPAIGAGRDDTAAAFESSTSSSSEPAPDVVAAPHSGPADASGAGRPSPDTDGPVSTAVEDAESVGDVLETADDGTTAAIEDALADSGPAVHTADGTEEDVVAVQESTIGGGPRRTVSTTGIDEVFAQLEDEAAVESRAERTEDSDTMADDDPFTTPVASDDEQPQPGAPAADAAGDDGRADCDDGRVDCDGGRADGDDERVDGDGESDDSADGAGGLAGGGPTRTVAETSADDILERVGGGSDFDTIADDEAEADPEAVLSDADDVPAVDADVPDGGDDSTGEETGSAGDDDDSAGDGAKSAGDEGADSESAGSSSPRSAPDAEESEQHSSGVTADADPEPSTDGGSGTVSKTSSSDLDVDDVAATLPPTDGATGTDGSAVADPAPSGTDTAPDDTDTPSDGTEPAPGGTETGPDAENESESVDTTDSDDGTVPDDANAAAGDSDSLSDADTDDGLSDADTEDSLSHTETDDGRPDLGDDLLGDDVEVLKGEEEVDVDADLLADHDPDPADGPLATGGGVAPVAEDDASDGPAPDAAAGTNAAASGDDAADETDGGSGFLARVKSVFGR